MSRCRKWRWPGTLLLAALLAPPALAGVGPGTVAGTTDCAGRCGTRAHVRRCAVFDWGTPVLGVDAFGLRIDFVDRHWRAQENPRDVTGEVELALPGGAKVVPVYPRRAFKGEADHERLVAYLPRDLRGHASFAFRVTLRAPRRAPLTLDGSVVAGRLQASCACEARVCCDVDRDATHPVRAPSSRM